MMSLHNNRNPNYAGPFFSHWVASSTLGDWGGRGKNLKEWGEGKLWWGCNVWEKKKINSSMDLGGVHKLLYLAEELLAIDGYWGEEESIFFRGVATGRFSML